MDLDDGGVDQGVFQIWIIRDGVEQPLPDLRLHPVAKAGEDAVPVPEQGWQIAPGTAGAHNPQHRLDKQAIVLAAAPWITGLAQTTRLHLRPLGVRQHKAVHPSREAQPSTDEKRESQQTLAGLFATGEAARAQSAACQRYRAELASLGSGGSRMLGAAHQQRAEIARMSGYYHSSGCSQGGFSSARPLNQHANLSRSLLRESHAGPALTKRRAVQDGASAETV